MYFRRIDKTHPYAKPNTRDYVSPSTFKSEGYGNLIDYFLTSSLILREIPPRLEVVCLPNTLSEGE